MEGQIRNGPRLLTAMNKTSPSPVFSMARLLMTALLLSRGAMCADVNPGYNVTAAADAMTQLASHSWEWGTAAEALLELFNPELSVFGANPFPNDRVPAADPGIVALAYARQFIQTGQQTLVPDSAVGDPASLGVSAILIGQSDSTYIDAANSEADYILNIAPRYSNGAISHRSDVGELWADFIAMAPPFCTRLPLACTTSPSLLYSSPLPPRSSLAKQYSIYQC